MVDCLSIEHLGTILENLADRRPMNRKLPPTLRKGQPNLIVCPEKEILRRVLSVYMEDETRPLPTCKEVLLCNEDTTAEEVELLVRRAVSDETGRIFMLVSVHLLNYEVACCAERAIEKHIKGEVEYQFAILCSSEQQDRSQLVTALDNYRAATLDPRRTTDVTEYLRHHLTRAQREEPAACEVDPERSDIFYLNILFLRDIKI